LIKTEIKNPTKLQIHTFLGYLSNITTKSKNFPTGSKEEDDLRPNIIMS